MKPPTRGGKDDRHTFLCNERAPSLKPSTTGPHKRAKLPRKSSQRIGACQHFSLEVDQWWNDAYFGWPNEHCRPARVWPGVAVNTNDFGKRDDLNYEVCVLTAIDYLHFGQKSLQSSPKHTGGSFFRDVHAAEEGRLLVRVDV